MANQAGAGAWRGYNIREMVSLTPSHPSSRERTRLRTPALAHCGSRVADASWAVLLSFTNAQSIPASVSTAYFVHTARGWRFWFRT
jgi:hypothetical protein